MASLFSALSLHLLLFGVATAAEDIEWTRRFGTVSVDTASSVAIDASGIYVAGITQDLAGNGDAFVARFDRNGTRLWMILSGVAGLDSPGDIATDGSGIYVSFNAGDFIGTDFDPISRSILRKYGQDGTVQWSRALGLPGRIEAILPIPRAFMSPVWSAAPCPGRLRPALPTLSSRSTIAPET